MGYGPQPINRYDMLIIFWKNYEKAEVSEATKNRYAGEARFFRAYFYFNLVKRYL